VGIWICTARPQAKNIRNLQSYKLLEVGMSYHELLPMPWEMEDLDDDEQTKNFKHEGNVVYLQKDE